MIKQKRTPETRTPLLLARGFVGLALLYTTFAALRLPILQEVYDSIAGFMFTFFWPIAVYCAFLALLAVDYRMKGQPVKARAMQLVILGIGVMSAGAFAAIRAILL